MADSKPGQGRPLTWEQAIQLRALGRMGKAMARSEPNPEYRAQRLRVAERAIRDAEAVLRKGSPSRA